MNPEYARLDPDKMFPYYAAVRIQQQIAIQVIGKTLKHNEEMQQVAKQTNYEQNFSRINLLV